MRIYCRRNKTSTQCSFGRLIKLHFPSWKNTYSTTHFCAEQNNGNFMIHTIYTTHAGFHISCAKDRECQFSCYTLRDVCCVLYVRMLGSFRLVCSFTAAYLWKTGSQAFAHCSLKYERYTHEAATRELINVFSVEYQLGLLRTPLRAALSSSPIRRLPSVHHTIAALRKESKKS